MSDVLQIKRWGLEEIKLKFYLVSHDITSCLLYDRDEENDNLEDYEYWFDFFEGCEVLTQSIPQIVEAISQMKENDPGDGSTQIKEIVVPPIEKLKPHSLCKMNQNVAPNVQVLPENGISQSELKLRLATLNKDSEVLKFFEDKTCPVCLSNYKEILDEDLHIVIPTCGHPLCCKCAEVILDSVKKECPLCRGRITAQSFNLMKFNADLEIDTENQLVFL